MLSRGEEFCYCPWDMQTTPRVALVGRPNVGKSTLFNRLIGMRQAVVADIAGTTRDRLERPLTWKEHGFILTDMAGLELTLMEQNEIREGMQRQVQTALATADVIIWVVDAPAGFTADDARVAELLRRLNKPVVVAANKCDHGNHEMQAMEFASTGFQPIIPLSAIHNRGTEALLDALVAVLPEQAEAPEVDERELQLTIVGRPNVGKSTLLNALVGTERSVVSAIAGTTRDSVDTVLPAQNLFGRIFTRWQTVRVVDTAGIRRRGKIDRSIEGWSVLRSYDAIDRAEVTLLLLDATEGLVHQDTQVAQRVVDAGKPLVLVINKWDLIMKKKNLVEGSAEESEEQERFLTTLRHQLSFMPWVPVIFISAAEGINVHSIGRLINDVYIAWSREISQEELDELTVEIKKHPRLTKLSRITCTHAQPPVFHLTMKGGELPHFSTRRFVENALRDYFELGPTPIKLWVEGSEKRRLRR